jgi:excisionase family DNA binding protein
MTIKEACEKWGLSNRWVNNMCHNGKIPGAQKFGTVWAIPADMAKPTQDRRVKTGEYKDWRKKYGKKKVINENPSLEN